jgi:hypothetical protein
MSEITSQISRVLFVASFVLAALAVLEKVANLFGYMAANSYEAPWRLLEIAGIALLFVCALQLREIHHSVMTRSGS